MAWKIPRTLEEGRGSPPHQSIKSASVSDLSKIQYPMAERAATADDAANNPELVEGASAFFHSVVAPLGQVQIPPPPPGWTGQPATVGDVARNPALLPEDWTERSPDWLDVRRNPDLSGMQTAYFHAREAPEGQREHPAVGRPISL